MAVTALRNAVPDEGVLVLGDRNDEAAATTQMIYGKGGSQPDRGKAFDMKDAGNAQRMFNITSFIAADRRHSRIFEGHKELIDHILVSVNLVPQLDAKLKKHPALVDRLIDYGAGGADGGLPSVHGNRN